MTFSKVIRVIGKIVFWGAFVLILLVLLMSFATHMTSGGRSMICSYSFGVVATGSMEPELKTGSFILIESVDPDDIVIDDVLMFQSSDPTVPNGLPVTHKVIEISRDENGKRVFTTKGVANAEQDKYPVYDEQIYGRVCFNSNILGAVVRFTQSRWLFPILIVILAVNLIFSMISVVKEAEKYKKDKSIE